MPKIKISIVPVAKARPRFRIVKSKGKEFVSTYTPKKTADYEKAIRQAFTGKINCFGGDIPMVVRAEFGMPIPKSTSKKRREEVIGKPHIKRPDLDNLMKAVLDGLQGVAFKDDSMIAELTGRKVYADEPYVLIEVGILSTTQEHKQ